ncbi:MAG: hypothetical protein OXU77_20645 [Gammaproteobacteria bacterium]|nr:hypothetical protein [Gammaproteobacteria bacterium]
MRDRVGLQQLKVLENEPNTPKAKLRQSVVIQLADVTPTESIATLRRTVQTAEYAHQGGLSRTGGAAYAHYLAGIDAERNSAKSVNIFSDAGIRKVDADEINERQAAFTPHHLP